MGTVVSSLYGKVWQFLKKLNIKLLYDPEIPQGGIHSQELEAETLTDAWTPIFIAALCTVAKK